MKTSTTTVKVRYAETDKMGVVHHANYLIYLELARIEWLNDIGISYKNMEEEGVMLPVYEMQFSFLSSAYFDDTLTIKTILKQLPRARITFDYEITNEAGKLLTKAQTTLVFVDTKTNRPTRCPEYVLDRLKN
tara:strand:- start:581 stop:979 length:399 start_codon:yes stop_codon:yes gene_type:complete